MVQIINSTSSISINGFIFPNNTLSFSIKHSTTIYINLVSSNTRIFSVEFDEFIDENGNKFSTPQAVINALLLNNSGGGDVTQVQLNAEILARTSADTLLQTNIDNEATSRAAADTTLSNRTTVLENNTLKVLYYTSISGTSGTITKPTGSTIILSDFPSGIDAIVETIVNGEPSGEEPLTAGGAYITVTSFDTSGNFVLSGTPTGYPVALIYIISIAEINKGNLTFDNIIGAPEVINGATKEYVDAKIVQTITNGNITTAPSEDAVFDALALKQNSLGYTAENVSNKSTSVNTDQASDTKYSSTKSIYDWATGLFATISNLALKADKVSITGSTKTKITYNDQGIVTSGTDATTADIADSSNKRYVTDANLTVIGNTSGTNTGDETAARIATINHGTSAKTSLVDADEITGQDSANSFSLIRTTWTNVKVFLKAYFDTLYGSGPTAWSSTTTITIGAVTSAPTKATTKQNDFVRYRTREPVIGSNTELIEVDYMYSATSNAGTAGGSGNYLFTLPNSYQFNSTEHAFYTGTTDLSDGSMSIYAIDRGKPQGMVYGDGFYDFVLIVPYDATRFRIITLGGNAPDEWVGSGWYPITQNTKVMSFKFTFYKQ